MKAIIKIVSAGKFTEDQQRIIKRVALVLIEHNLSVKVLHSGDLAVSDNRKRELCKKCKP